ncbi:MAG TPA: S53 family peptidase [Streptosporangiaceae bacterium]|nr:S53 family peptidase [Streptosporangiaceae bacterium]
MRAARWWALTGAGALVASVFAGVVPATASASPTPNRVALRGSMTPVVERSHPAGKIAGTSSVSFDLVLSLRNAPGAQKFVRQVSSPGSSLFHKYLSDAQWVARFGPTKAEVTRARSWLRRQGLTVVAVPKDRLLVEARGSASQVEKAFGTKLGYFKVQGHRVRLATSAITVPGSMASTVSGTVGINQYVATTSLTAQLAAAKTAKTAKAKPNQEPPPPAGFRNPQPCSSYWGQKTDTADSGSLYKPYTSPLPYDICGYKPAQLRGGYGLNPAVNKGDDGSGKTIAIVDAYDSPTLLSDAQHYFRLNDPSHLLTASQFTNVQPATIDDQAECGASGWYPEQALDVESSHSMAPGANIEFVGAQDCFNNSLLAAVNTAVTSGASVVTDSWGDAVGDLFDDAASKTAFDDTFMLADATGVSVLFSSGDDGDNFADFGLDAPDYPASSPYITAVGGTTLEVNSHNARQAEYGWSTAKQTLCATKTTNCGTATTPASSLAWQAGDGAGTSYYYTQPYYQAGVVPSDLALRNEAFNGPVPARVIPDMSMDADAQSGMLIGLTQTFPDGTYYDQFKEGGTSLASPLLAGVIADVDGAAGTSLGFINPVLYKADQQTPSVFNDILAPTNPNSTAVIRVDYANSVDTSDGYLVSLRAIDYQGPETYCDATGNCATRPVSNSPGKGYDSLTGLGTVGSKFIYYLSKF